MKRYLLILGCLLASALPASAQYYRMDFSLQNAMGQAISGATVTVYNQSACGSAATTLATIYPAATGGTPISGSQVTTDGFGHAYAYMAAACYTVVYYSQYTGTLTYADQGPNGFGSGAFLPLAGGTMTGTLNMAGATNTGGYTQSGSSANTFTGTTTLAGATNSGSYTQSGSGANTFTGVILAPSVNTVLNAGQYSGSDILAKITAASTACASVGCTILVPKGSYTTTTTTFTYPSGYPVTVKLLDGVSISGACPMFDASSAASGSGLNANSLTNQITCTSGTIGVKVGNGAAGVVTNWHQQNIGVNCNSIAAWGFQFDTVQSSYFGPHQAINCTSGVEHWQVSATTSDTNNSWNTIVQPTSPFTGASPMLMQIDNNTAKTSNFTQNTIIGANVNFTGTAGILINGADNNWWIGTRCFRVSGTGTCVVLSATDASNYGGIDQHFYGFLGGQPIASVSAASGTTGNEIVGYDYLNGESPVSLAGNAEMKVNDSWEVGPSGAQSYSGTHPTQWFNFQSNANNSTFSKPQNLTSGCGMAWNWTNGGGEGDIACNPNGGSGSAGLFALYKWDGTNVTGPFWWAGTTTTKAYHFTAMGTPTIVCGTGAGTSPAVCTITGTDEGGYISITTGSATATAATVATITLANGCTTGISSGIPPKNAAAATLSGTSTPFSGETSATQWVITSNSVALGTSTAYVWNYHVTCY